MTPPPLQTAPGDAEQIGFLEGLVQKALRSGAENVEALCIDSHGLSVSWRQGKLESAEQTASACLGLRVLIGKKQACVSTTDFRAETIERTIEQAVSMAKVVPEDPFCGLAEEIPGHNEPLPALDLFDPREPSADELVEAARLAFEAAQSVPKVTRGESAEASASQSLFSIVNSRGFAGAVRRSSHSLVATAIAGEGTGMTFGWDYDSCLHRADLKSPERIGIKAGEQAVSHLGARKMPSGQFPVVFEPKIAKSLLSHFASAISGPSIARGTSFLKDAMNKQIFETSVSIVDDPFLVRGLRSRAFDAEGFIPQKRKMVDQGILSSWFLDLRSARQLGLKTTAHAVSSPGSIPSPSAHNLYIEAGEESPEELIQNIKDGFYVTGLMGDGVSLVTGDFSQAAKGFWIENGEITFPVHEMTVAGNLKNMFRAMRPANDLVFQFGFNAPTLRIDGMTVAGS